MTDIELVLARIIHPNFYFFREIAAHIVEGCDIEDKEERYTLEEAIIQFLKGGVMTEATKLAIASYFNQDPQTWQNLWDTYISCPNVEPASLEAYQRYVIHPCLIFFAEISARIAESHAQEEETRYQLEDDIGAFLEGATMTEAAKEAMAAYFGDDPQMWQNLWNNYSTDLRRRYPSQTQINKK